MSDCPSGCLENFNIIYVCFFFLLPTLTGKQIVSMIFYSNLEGFSCHLPAYNSNKNHVAQRYLVLAIV